MDGPTFKRVCYKELSGKQKEIYNFQEVAAVLAKYGFNSIKLDDDWLGADFLAFHSDDSITLRVQLKGRLTIDKKYCDKGLHICFRYGTDWYLIPHDTLIEVVRANTNWLNTSSWERGRYSSANPSRRLLEALAKFKVEDGNSIAIAVPTAGPEREE